MSSDADSLDAIRDKAHMAGYGHWTARIGGEPNYPGITYMLSTSLSHALITEIALDCTYPASSLKERVYALSFYPLETPDRCSILIYTATAGAQGTLGDLVGTAPRFAQMLRAALARSAICSNGPVCADREPMSIAATEPHTAQRATDAFSLRKRVAR